MPEFQMSTRNYEYVLGAWNPTSVCLSATDDTQLSTYYMRKRIFPANKLGETRESQLFIVVN